MDFDEVVPNSNDQTLQCKDCGSDFIFTERDQEFFKVHGFETPKRCKSCRAAKKKKYAEREQYDRNHSN